jgi:hypothetical protein
MNQEQFKALLATSKDVVTIKGKIFAAGFDFKTDKHLVFENCTFGKYCTFGRYCKFGESCNFGHFCTFCGYTLEQIKADFFSILGVLTSEINGLKTALIEGKVDGRVYIGACACLVGTIANIRGKRYKEMEDLVPNPQRPVEVFFSYIRKGDTPATNPISAIVLGWITEFQATPA